jgi:metal-dependent amidase/aminoacylase/carboxypeptidase family protein
LILIGQPAEEIGAGASAMLNDGLFTRVPKLNSAILEWTHLHSGRWGYLPGSAKLTNV